MNNGKHPKGFKAVYLCSRGWRTSNTIHSEPRKSRYHSEVSETEIVPSRWSGVTTTGALLSGNGESATDGQKLGCFYCQRNDHWSDQGETYPPVESRKAKIKETALFA